MNATVSDWQAITPLHLRKPVGHIRKGFETGRWKCSQITSKLCFFALHEDIRKAGSLAEWFDLFKQYRQVIGSAASREFNRTITLCTPPAVFRAYFDAFYEGLKTVVHEQFEQILKIGLANSGALGSEPVAWAKTHIHFLILQSITPVGRWIKEVCDVQEAPKPDLTQADFEEQVFWRKWRAPLLIYMEPAGNKPYDPATVWNREDEFRTRSILQARCRRFTEFLDIDLDNFAGIAYVRVSQDKEQSRSLEHRSSEADSASPRFTTQTHEDNRREETQGTQSDQAAREAIIRMVRNPQAHSVLLVAQAARYFKVRPRTIYRWIEAGKLRSGARRGSVTIESIQLFEKKRARKSHAR